MAGRAAYAHLVELPTRWFDNDIYGHLNNTVHYQMFDTAVNGYLMAEGGLDPHNGETIFLVVESGCRYFHPLAFPETITVGLRVAKLGSSSVTYEIGLFGAGEEAAATGHFVHVNVDRIARTSRRIPDITRAALRELVMPA